MNLFDLARKNLEKTGKPFTNLQVLDLAITIRRQLDKEAVKKHKIQCKNWRLKNKRENK